MFTCPTCSARLVRARTPERRTVWRCPAEHGTCVTLPVLGRLVGRGRGALLDPGSPGASRGERSEPPRGTCPGCARRMRARALAIPARPRADVCTGCKLAWFAPGVLESTPRGPRARAPRVRRDRKRSGGKPEIKRDAPDLISEQIFGFCGLPVERDFYLRRRRPRATWTVLALMAVVTLWAHLSESVMDFAFDPSEPLRGLGLPWITGFFAHAGWAHALGNGYFLAVFGDDVEEDLGSRGLLGLMGSAHLLSNVIEVLGAPHPYAGSLGASVGVMAVMTFYGLRFRGRMISFLLPVYSWRYAMGTQRLPWLSVPAFVAALYYVAFDLVAILLDVDSNVAHGGHLLGALTGVLGWACVRWSRRAETRGEVAPNDGVAG